MKISIIGQGNMAKAIQAHLQDAGNLVELVGREVDVPLAEIVILAIPYAEHEEFARAHQEKLANKIVIDISNPVNFATLEELIVPPGQSATQLLQQKLPQSFVLKAFNTTSAFMLNNKMVGERDLPTVLIAGDHAPAKQQLLQALEGANLNAVDVGGLKQASQLEALGLLQMYLVKNGFTEKTGGFSLLGLKK
ncbi:NADPH-dependent F420 reductase [[Pasteurella] aerogenes]|nr:diguanylate cyclase [[Pasteurella] aerogenes]